MTMPLSSALIRRGARAVRPVAAARLALLAPLLAPLLAACVVARGLRAQDTESLVTTHLRAGTRVRVTAPAADMLYVPGRLEAVRGDTLVLRAEGTNDTLLVDVGSVTRLEVYGRGRAGERAARVGVAVGALTGTGLYVKWCLDPREACARDSRPADCSCDCSCNRTYEEPDDCSRFTVGSLFTLAGALLGGALGYAMAEPHWEQVRVPLSFGIAPRPGGGLVVGASLAFGGRRR
jgi:hypothetical protein